nr:hypothetical protein [Mesobacillus foraminis]
MSLEQEMEFLIERIGSHPLLFMLISLLLNTLIAISGILPSAFLTAANILVLGFANGLLLSIAGEAIGAVVCFLLYRKGLAIIPSSQKKSQVYEYVPEPAKENGRDGSCLSCTIPEVVTFHPLRLGDLNRCIQQDANLVFCRSLYGRKDTCSLH